jgi:hypothetical protein
MIRATQFPIITHGSGSLEKSRARFLVNPDQSYYLVSEHPLVAELSLILR